MIRKRISTNVVLLFAILLMTRPAPVFSQVPDARLKTKKQVVEEGRAGLPQISVGELKDKMDHHKKYLLVDVRTERERNAGYISGSVWLPRGVLEFKIQGICPDADTDIIVYCRKGGRSALAAKTLQQLGYTSVFNLEGGVNAWGKQGYSLYNWHGEIKVVHFDKNDPYLSTYDIFVK